MTPKDRAAKLNGPCQHQLDAAQGEWIVPTLRIRARDCDDCLREAFSECARDERERCANILADRAAEYRRAGKQKTSSFQSALGAVDLARAQALEQAHDKIVAAPPRPDGGDGKERDNG